MQGGRRDKQLPVPGEGCALTREPSAKAPGGHLRCPCLTLGVPVRLCIQAAAGRGAPQSSVQGPDPLVASATPQPHPSAVPAHRVTRDAVAPTPWCSPDFLSLIAVPGEAEPTWDPAGMRITSRRARTPAHPNVRQHSGLEPILTARQGVPVAGVSRVAGRALHFQAGCPVHGIAFALALPP